jgi:hypothetical protein
MTLARRVAAIETSLSPTQLVLRWLADAHSYGRLERYVASLVQTDPPANPVDRLAREAAHGAQAAMRGKRPEVVAEAVRSALRETVFRFELVVRINVSAHETLDREALIDMALSAQVALLGSEEETTRRADPTYAERLATRRDLLRYRVSELGAIGKARALLVKRYLEGHGALFPDLEAAWVEQVASTQAMADFAVRMAKVARVPAAVPRDPEALTPRAAELVADLVEPAKATALDKIGEGQWALGIATGWARTGLGRAQAQIPDTRIALGRSRLESSVPR